MYVWVIGFHINDQHNTHVFMQYAVWLLAMNHVFLTNILFVCTHISITYLKGWGIIKSKSKIISQLYLYKSVARQKGIYEKCYIQKTAPELVCVSGFFNEFKFSTLNLLSAVSPGSISGFDLIMHCMKCLTWCLQPEFCSF